MQEVRRIWLQIALVVLFLGVLYLHSLLAYLQQRYPTVEFPAPAEILLQPSTYYKAVSNEVWKTWAGFISVSDKSVMLVLNEMFGMPQESPAAPGMKAAEALIQAAPPINLTETGADEPIQPALLTANKEIVRPVSYSDQPNPSTVAAISERKSRLPQVKDTTADDLAPYLAADERFLFIGDSLMQGVAPSIRRVLCGQLKRSCEDLSKPSTGMSQKGFHDWPAVVKDKFSSTRYTALFVFMGANDPWDFIDQKRRIRFDSEEWTEVYGQRVANIIRTAVESDAEVYWIGLPNMKPSRLARGMVVQNQIFSTLVREAGGVFIDTRGIVDDGTDVYSRAIRLPDGRELVVRQDDGVHFTVAGQKRIGAAVLQSLIEHRRQRDASKIAHGTLGK